MPYAMQAPNPSPPESLADIRNVSVDPALPRPERIASFIRQIGNPYRFRCGGMTINVRFTEGGPTLEECLQGILR